MSEVVSEQMSEAVSEDERETDALGRVRRRRRGTTMIVMVIAAVPVLVIATVAAGTAKMIFTDHVTERF